MLLDISEYEWLLAAMLLAVESEKQRNVLRNVHWSTAERPTPDRRNVFAKGMLDVVSALIQRHAPVRTDRQLATEPRLQIG